MNRIAPVLENVPCGAETGRAGADYQHSDGTGGFLGHVRSAALALQRYEYLANLTDTLPYAPEALRNKEGIARFEVTTAAFAVGKAYLSVKQTDVLLFDRLDMPCTGRAFPEADGHLACGVRVDDTCTLDDIRAGGHRRRIDRYSGFRERRILKAKHAGYIENDVHIHGHDLLILEGAIHSAA